MKLSLKAFAATAVVGFSLASVSYAQDTAAPAPTPVPAAPAPAATPVPEDRNDRADGGFFFEPGITYELGDTNTKFSKAFPGVLNDSDGEANGFGGVLRLGFHINDVFFVAADGRYSLLRHESSINGEKSDAKTWSIAPVVGLQTPVVGLRVWGGYVVKSEMDPDRAGDYDLRFMDGSGALAGAGFRVGPVSLNVEYKYLKYDRTDFQRLPFGVTANATDVETTDQAWIASVTFPLAL